MIVSDERLPGVGRLAAMGGAYGNVPALWACLADAEAQGCDGFVFLGDAVGCCGHSTEALAIVRERFAVRVAGNLDQQAASGSPDCGCGYSSAEDERVSGRGFTRALQGLSPEDARWLSSWPELVRLETGAGALLLAHGSPDRTNEFLYSSALDESRILGWLERHEAVGLIVTHTGLPWHRPLEGERFALNCGVVGKPDHDGDPAVHYAIASASDLGWDCEIRRVAYDHEAWARQLEAEGVDPVFVSPLRTGIWTTGVASLPGPELAGARKPAVT